jgi:hypothetical protein
VGLLQSAGVLPENSTRTVRNGHLAQALARRSFEWGRVSLQRPRTFGSSPAPTLESRDPSASRGRTTETADRGTGARLRRRPGNSPSRPGSSLPRAMLDGPVRGVVEGRRKGELDISATKAQGRANKYRIMQIRAVSCQRVPRHEGEARPPRRDLPRQGERSRLCGGFWFSSLWL